MSLERGPQTESRLMEYAAHEGVNTEEYINRLLERATSKRAIHLRFSVCPCPRPLFHVTIAL